MKTVVMLPTYNEKENIEKIIEEILKQDKSIEVLVVDDDSPDGTWKIVQEICKKDKRVHLFLRKKNKGRGFAGREGFKKCIEMDADFIVEMDADFSHNPEYIPKMLEKAKENDIVLGSRFVNGGKDIDRGVNRRLLSKLGKFYISALLGIKQEDPTSGYRCFSKKAMLEIEPQNLQSEDPFIVTEVLYRATKKKLKICEIPIIFEDRKLGSSKLGASILSRYFINVIRLHSRKW